MAQQRKAEDEAPSTRPPYVIPATPGQHRRWSNLVTAAIRLLDDQDYESTQVRDVADLAGVSLSTLYRYFNSKEHLFAAGLLQWSEQFRQRIVEEASGEAAEGLASPFQRAITAFERQPHVCAVMLELRASNDVATAKTLEAYAREQTTALEAAIAPIVPDHAATTVDVMVAVLDHHLRNWTLGQETILDVRRAIDATAELILASDVGA